MSTVSAIPSDTTGLAEVERIRSAGLLSEVELAKLAASLASGAFSHLRRPPPDRVAAYLHCDPRLHRAFRRLHRRGPRALAEFFAAVLDEMGADPAWLDTVLDLDDGEAAAGDWPEPTLRLATPEPPDDGEVDGEVEDPGEQVPTGCSVLQGDAGADLVALLRAHPQPFALILRAARPLTCRQFLRLWERVQTGRPLTRRDERIIAGMLATLTREGAP